MLNALQFNIHYIKRAVRTTMKTIEEIITENPHHIRLWDDGVTLDITVDNIKLLFTEELVQFKCKCCNSQIINGNETILIGMNKSTHGAELKCNTCNQLWFIHKPVTCP